MKFKINSETKFTIAIVVFVLFILVSHLLSTIYWITTYPNAKTIYTDKYSSCSELPDEVVFHRNEDGEVVTIEFVTYRGYVRYNHTISRLR